MKKLFPFLLPLIAFAAGIGYNLAIYNAKPQTFMDATPGYEYGNAEMIAASRQHATPAQRAGFEPTPYGLEAGTEGSPAGSIINSSTATPSGNVATEGDPCHGDPTCGDPEVPREPTLPMHEPSGPCSGECEPLDNRALCSGECEPLGPLYDESRGSNPEGERPNTSTTTSPRQACLFEGHPDAEYREHVVVSGDTLWELAEKMIGNSFRWQELNSSYLGDPRHLKVGSTVSFCK
jgi:nucleoid-associated protein YgaU